MIIANQFYLKNSRYIWKSLIIQYLINFFLALNQIFKPYFLTIKF